MVFALILFLFLPKANAFELFTIDEVNINYHRYAPYSRNQLITDNGLSGRQMADGVALIANSKLLTYGYWENKITGLTDRSVNGSGQYRAVGWEYRLGIQFLRGLQIGYYHHSQHVIDKTPKFSFPLEDAFEIKLILFKEGSQDGLIDALVNHSSKSNSDCCSIFVP